MLPDEKQLLAQVFTALQATENKTVQQEIEEAELAEQKEEAIKPIPLKSVQQLLDDAKRQQ